MKRLVLLSLAFMSSLYAQQTELKSAFISANLGAYVVAQSQFDKVYDSNIGFMPGITLGLPLSIRTYIYGKASYFFKNGTPINYTYDLQNGNFVLVSESKEGTAKFREWLFNIGLLYNIFLSEEYTLGINGGLTLVSLYEEKKNSSYSVTSKGGGLLGFFGGLIIERNFENSPFSAIGAISYNLSRGDIQSFAGNYGGLNVNLGVRYYFNDRKRTAQ